MQGVFHGGPVDGLTLWFQLEPKPDEPGGMRSMQIYITEDGVTHSYLYRGGVPDHGPARLEHQGALR